VAFFATLNKRLVRLDAVGVYGAMGATTSRFASGEATSPPISDLLRCVAARRSEAVRITAEIAHAQRQVNTLLYRRVPGELVDEIEDEIIALRTRLMNNDVALMMLVEQARPCERTEPGAAPARPRRRVPRDGVSQGRIVNVALG
jgi:hypothetical protein